MMQDRTLLLLLISNALASIGVGVAMIAVPWLLVSQPDGGMLFGILITASNVALALATPWIGVFIDSTCRKTFMVRLRLAFLVGLVAVAVLHAVEGAHANTAALVLYYFLGAAFYVINIPLRTAFVQELYHGADYARVNGILEVENQVAALATGALAILLIEWVGFHPVLILNFAGLAGAVLCIQKIRVHPHRSLLKRTGPLRDIRDGITLLTKKPVLSILLLASSLPYVTVILYTYLHPVALAQLTGSSGETYALVEMLFALGAIGGGWFLLRKSIEGHSIQSRLGWFVLAFSGAAIAQAVFPFEAGFLVIAILFGFFNAVVRVLRQTLLMREIMPEEIGRVGAFLQCWIIFWRVAALGIATALVSRGDVPSALWFAATLPVAAFVAMTLLPKQTPKIYPLRTKESYR